MKKVLLILSLFTIKDFYPKLEKKLVPVYHCIAKKGSVESVKNHGLLNWQTLWKRGIVDIQPCIGLFSDRAKVIYFNPNPSEERYADIAYLVDPATTYVYNQEHRAHCNMGYYQGSEILLQDYLANYHAAEELKKHKKPDEIILLDYITSEPIVVSIQEFKQWKNLANEHGSFYGKADGYRPEVIIATNCIPPERLIFLKKNEEEIN